MRCCQRITRTHPAEQSSLCLALTLHLYVPIIVCGKHQLTEVCHKISWPGASHTAAGARTATTFQAKNGPIQSIGPLEHQKF